jgi:hypothetical protein
MVPVGPDHRTDDESTAGRDEDDRDPVPAASWTNKGKILDGLCVTTGWHRNHARKALAAALRPNLVRPRRPPTPFYGPEIVGALRFCWAVSARRPASGWPR